VREVIIPWPGLPVQIGPFEFLMSESADPIRIPITDTFDLHTIQPGDAKEALEAYLEEARKLGLTALRIIHGRGIGVQREMVRTVLARTEFVAAFRDAPAEAGGWGATIVTLRR
jgi:dsDNA-specific endonuclease/ATPase MutS2